MIRIYDINRRGYMVGLPRNISSLQDFVLDAIKEGMRAEYQEQEHISSFIVEGDIGDCNICLETMKNGEECRALPCSETTNHRFHKKCIDTWLRSHNTCPTCRAKVFDHLVRITAEDVAV